MRQTLALAALLLGLLASTSTAQSRQASLPDIALTGVPFEVAFTGVAPDSSGVTDVSVTAGSAKVEGQAVDGSAGLKVTLEEWGTSDVAAFVNGQEVARKEVRVIPGWFSLLPAFVAIALALIFRQVVPSIFLGILVGGWLTYGGTLPGLWYGTLDTVQVYVVGAMTDGSHVAIILFSLMIGGMVGIISANGGTLGIVRHVVRWAKSPNRGQLATSFLGLAIFFDDYANTLIVGNTMRPVTDRLRISREKLAYIVDSTAAPVAAIALVTTWIGFEIGLIDSAVKDIDAYSESAYSIFLNSIAYSYYPLLAIFFVLLVSATGRDFGPMLRAETRARKHGLVSAPGAHTGESVEEAGPLKPRPDAPLRATNAVVPVLVLVLGTLTGIYVTGVQASGADAGLRDIIGAGDSYKALVWASLFGVLSAAFLSLVQRLLTLEQIVEAWYAGLKSMMLAIIILVLAWSLASVDTVLQTGPYLVSILGDTLQAEWLPALVFVLSALTAFATGSSWGVMGIVMPLVVPVAWAVMEIQGMTTSQPADYHILYSSVSAVLAGAVWGDHCSPISDTTILSSMASGCDHIDHVRTQLPYAVVVGLVGVVFGTIPAAYGLPWWLCLLVGIGLLTVGLRFVGTKHEPFDPKHPSAATSPTV
ncbi:MAG TPA: Na+/H+ antiporter NhaC family protein [Rhodothermales bacterium]|nr:Na+/H+ antiporter NhaC family protein [Rhodothermales bacterium]